MLERLRVGNRKAGVFGRLGAFRVAYVPSVDSAPVMVASELGFFAARGVRVTLCREVGWAGVREKLLHVDVDAAIAPAGMAYALHCGLGTVARACVASLFLGRGGGAMLLSPALRDLGVRDAETLREAVEAQRGRRPFVFAHGYGLSAQAFALREWLGAAGIEVGRDVRLINVPPMLTPSNLLAGHVDGCWVEEPWTTSALLTESGWSPASGHSPASPLPDKVFLALQDFVNGFPQEHAAMTAALVDACVFCAEPGNRDELASLLARNCFPELSPSVLGKALDACLTTPASPPVEHAPTRDRARQVFRQVAATGLADGCFRFRRDVVARVFREDLFRAATGPSTARATAPLQASARRASRSRSALVFA